MHHATHGRTETNETRADPRAKSNTSSKSEAGIERNLHGLRAELRELFEEVAHDLVQTLHVTRLLARAQITAHTTE